MNILMILILLIMVLLVRWMWKYHHEKPEDCRYLETWWDYPLPQGVPLRMRYKFTNHPRGVHTDYGRLGRGYECYDLTKPRQVKSISEINMDFDKNNYGEAYLPNDIINKAVKNHEYFLKDRRKKK